MCLFLRRWGASFVCSIFCVKTKPSWVQELLYIASNTLFWEERQVIPKTVNVKAGERDIKTKKKRRH